MASCLRFDNEVLMEKVWLSVVVTVSGSAA